MKPYEDGSTGKVVSGNGIDLATALWEMETECCNECKRKRNLYIFCIHKKMVVYSDMFLLMSKYFCWWHEMFLLIASNRREIAIGSVFLL